MLQMHALVVVVLAALQLLTFHHGCAHTAGQTSRTCRVSVEIYESSDVSL